MNFDNAMDVYKDDTCDIFLPKELEQNVTKNEKVSLPYVEKDNCDFKGWYIDYEKFESGFLYE